MPPTADSPAFLNPQALAKLQGLRLRAQHIVEGYVAGLHRSPYHGFSIEFAEHREYAPGDDLRYIDWKVYGRSDKFHLKQYEDETNLLCYLVVDTSESMTYRGPDAPWSKLEHAQCAAAALAWLVLHQQDSAGLAVFDQEVRAVLRPSSSAAQMQQVLHVLENATVAKKTRAGEIFHELAQRFTKRGVVIILSDLFDNVAEILSGLKHFRHRWHDVVVMHVLDPAELDFPFQHATMFQGLEDMPELLADPPALREAYLAEFHRYQDELRQGCRSQQIDYQVLRTDEPLDRALAAWLSARAARLK